MKYLNLEEKRNIHEAVYTLKAIAGKIPKNIAKQYKELKSFGSNRSAVNGSLKVPKHKTSKYENSVLYRTVKTWNKTPVDIRTDSADTFKRKLQASSINNKFST